MMRKVLVLLSATLLVAACNFPPATSEPDVEQAVRLTLEAEFTQQASAQPTAPPPTASAEPASPTPLPPTPTATANPYVVTARVDANCRRGPRTLYPVQQILAQGQQAQAKARNNDPNNIWLEVELSDGQNCWMSDVTLNFSFDPGQLPIGVIPPTPVFTPGAIVGTVWHDYCDSSAPDPTACEQVDGEYQANGQLDLGETTIVGVTVLLGAGDCPSIGLTSAVTGPDASGGYEFSDLIPGKYCVTVDANGDGNGPILDDGIWTWPQGFGSDVARRTVTVESGQTTSAVIFGWDFANLP